MAMLYPNEGKLGREKKERIQEISDENEIRKVKISSWITTVHCFTFKSEIYSERFYISLAKLGLGEKMGNMNCKKENFLLKKGYVLKMYQLAKYWENKRKVGGIRELRLYLPW